MGHTRGGEQVPYFLDPRVTGGFGGELGADFFELMMHSPVIVGDAVDFCHRPLGLIDASMAIGVARSLRKQENTKAKDDGPEEPDTQGDTPGATVPARFGAIVDAAGEEDTKRDEKLIGADESAADLTGSGLSLIHGHEERKSSYTETGNPTAYNNLLPNSL